MAEAENLSWDILKNHCGKEIRKFVAISVDKPDKQQCVYKTLLTQSNALFIIWHETATNVLTLFSLVYYKEIKMG